jgi:hypothetical protein
MTRSRRGKLKTVDAKKLDADKIETVEGDDEFSPASRLVAARLHNKIKKAAPHDAA